MFCGRCSENAVPTVGEEFHPASHEAWALWSATICPTTVAEEIRRGYKLRDSCCVLRWCASFPTQNRRKK